MPPSLAAARRAREANMKLLRNAHTTFAAKVKRGGREVPAVIAFFEKKSQVKDLPKFLKAGDDTVPLVVKIAAPPRPEGPGG